MPEIDLSVYEKIAPVDLEQRRRAIIAKAAGDHDNLSVEELHELCAITGVLRRRASGPPRVKRKAANGKPAKPSLEDLA